MTQEEKDLLLKDLCGRLPYGTMVECSIGNAAMDVVLHSAHIDEFIEQMLIVKPYLRPMSSMTEEEKAEFMWLEDKCAKMPTYEYVAVETYRVFDWLNAHHFDYRGLIEKGLAIETTEETYG